MPTKGLVIVHDLTKRRKRGRSRRILLTGFLEHDLLDCYRVVPGLILRNVISHIVLIYKLSKIYNKNTCIK